MYLSHVKTEEAASTDSTLIRVNVRALTQAQDVKFPSIIVPAIRVKTMPHARIRSVATLVFARQVNFLTQNNKTK